VSLTGQTSGLPVLSIKQIICQAPSNWLDHILLHLGNYMQGSRCYIFIKYCPAKDALPGHTLILWVKTVFLPKNLLIIYSHL
jgi:hypothetical protein